METFSDFTWDDLLPEITHQEYENFKSRYFTIHDNIKKYRDVEKVSILADIDFAIELIETDRINVAYIMNLLKNIDLKNKEQKEKDINHIFDELDRSDSPELRGDLGFKQLKELVTKVMQFVVQNCEKYAV